MYRGARIDADQVRHGQRALGLEGQYGAWRIASQNYLADHCTPEAAVGGPLEFCHSVFLVSANGPPKRRHALAVGIRVSLREYET